MKPYKYSSVLTIAGSDSGGGAGIQGDVKTISSLGCYATTAITAITVQNTIGVTGIHSIPADIVKGQIEAILTDITPDAIKIGMVYNLQLAETIAGVLQLYPYIPIVLDPVMAATSGVNLMENNTIAGLKNHLFPISALITPNLDEASVLAGMPIYDVATMRTAGIKIMDSGSKAVLIKGGHMKGEKLTSLYFSSDGAIEEFHYDRINTSNTHGTGCTLSSAIAAYLAQGMAMRDAIAYAQDYVNQAIINGKDTKTGKGNGPLNHFFNPQILSNKGVSRIL